MNTDDAKDTQGYMEEAEAYIKAAPRGPYRDMVLGLLCALEYAQAGHQDVVCELRYLSRLKSP